MKTAEEILQDDFFKLSQAPGKFRLWLIKKSSLSFVNSPKSFANTIGNRGGHVGKILFSYMYN